MATHASNGDWPSLRPTTLSDGVYSALRERIREGILQPGAPIREAELGEVFGVSRTPVREALGRLAVEGLLERLPQRGFRVAVPPTEHLLQVYPLVRALDAVAARLAVPRLRPVDFDHMEALNRDLASALARNDVRASILADHAFHTIVAKGSGNDALREMCDVLRCRLLQGEAARFERCVDPDGVCCRTHRRFLEAARRGDAAAAARVFEEDVFWTATAVLQAVGE